MRFICVIACYNNAHLLLQLRQLLQARVLTTVLYCPFSKLGKNNGSGLRCSCWAWLVVVLPMVEVLGLILCYRQPLLLNGIVTRCNCCCWSQDSRTQVGFDCSLLAGDSLAYCEDSNDWLLSCLSEYGRSTFR